MSAGGVPSPVSDISVANANPAGSPSVSSQNNAVPSASTGNGESCTSVPGGVGVRLSQTPAGSAAEMPFSSKPSPAALPRPPQPPPPPHASSSPSGPSVAAPTQGHHPPATAGASSPAPAPSDKGRKLSSTSSQRRPTLFNLLDALAHDSVTTPDQRNCIRSVVTDFLNHSLPHARVYTFIGAIVGHDVLHAMVRKLEEEPAKLGAPDQGGLARIEKAFGLTKSTGGSFMNEKTEKTEKSGKPEDRHPVAGVGAAPSSSQGGVPAGGVASYASSARAGGGGPGASSDQQQAPAHHPTAADAVADPAAPRSTRVQGTPPASQNCTAAVTPSAKLGALGAHHAREEVVIRAMRRNLEARRQLQGSLDVFDRVKWLPVRRTLTPVPVFGHSLITFSNTAVLFGGSNTEGAVSFRNLFVVNMNDFSVRGFPMSGESPCERDGHTTTGLTTAGGPAVVLFGGCSKETFLNDVYVLEVDQKKWVRRLPVGKAPQPRDQHIAAVFPARTETGTCRENCQEVLSEFLFIMGGRTGCPEFYQAANDMWSLHLASDTWCQVQLEGNRVRPPPRFGCAAVWSDDILLTLFGGETTASTTASNMSGVGTSAGHAINGQASSSGGSRDGRSRDPSARRLLLDDMWHFKISDVVTNHHTKGAHVVGEWVQEKFEGGIAPRSHYAAIFITQRYQEPRAEPRTVERLMVVTSGLTYEPDTRTASNGSAKHAGGAGGGDGWRRVVETDQISVYFFSKRKWCTLKPRYPADYVYDLYGARQRHVACFFETQPLSQRAPRPPVPCLLIHGGFRGNQVLNDAWVLSLTGEDPYRGALFASNANRMGGGSMCGVSPFLSSSSLQQQVMGRTLLSLRMHPSYYIRETHSPGILWALCSQQRWVFGAVGQLIENSLSPVVAASRNVHVRWEETPEKEPMLSLQDDGQGVDYPAMNKLLRLYGTFEPGDRMRKSYEYGCGFKMAFGRLSSSCAVMSRTQGTIGVGMLSMELMGHCDARELVAPMCMWRLPNKELINRDPNNASDHRHHQRLLMSYTPFTTPNLLAEQINLLGTAPGTRVVFWDMRDDLDFLVFDPVEGTLFLSCAPPAPAETLGGGSRVRPAGDPKPKNVTATGTGAGSSTGETSDAAQEKKEATSITKPSEAHVPPAAVDGEQSKAENDLSGHGATEGGGPVSRGSDKGAEETGDSLEASGGVQDMSNGAAHCSELREKVGAALLKKEEAGADMTRPRAQKEEEGPPGGGGPELLDLDDDGQPLGNANAAGGPPQHGGEGPAGKTGGAGSGQSCAGSAEETRDATGDDGPCGSLAKDDKANKLEGGLPPLFPLWTCSRHAPDYCLPTYLFWFHLHSPAQIHVQGVPLLPKAASIRRKNPSVRENATVAPSEGPPAESGGGVVGGGAAKASEPEDARNQQVPTDGGGGKTARGGADAQSGLNGAGADEAKTATKGLEKTEGTAEVKEGEGTTSGIEASVVLGRSLYFFLKERLHCQAELQYLFTPADHATGCFALLGFLNDPRSPSLTADESSQSPPRVCEAGVLLYFRQRLIRRIDAAFPDYPRALDAAKEPAEESLFGGRDGRGRAEMFKYCLTAVVNVPEWMVPSMTKQDFIHENNEPFLKFKSRLFKLLDEYLRRCRDSVALQAWLDNSSGEFSGQVSAVVRERRAKKLATYQDELRRVRPKRRLGEDLTDEDQPRRSPTPPATHSTSGAPIWTGERGSGGAGGSATAAAGMPEQSAEPPAKQRATETNEQWSAATNDAGKNAEARDASPDRQPGPEASAETRPESAVKEPEMASDTEAPRAPEAPAPNESASAVVEQSEAEGGASRSTTDVVTSAENPDAAVQEAKTPAAAPVGEDTDLNGGAKTETKTSSAPQKEGEQDVEMD